MTNDEIQKELNELLTTIGILQMHVDRSTFVHHALGVAYDALHTAIADDADTIQDGNQ